MYRVGITSVLSGVLAMLGTEGSGLAREPDWHRAPPTSVAGVTLEQNTSRRGQDYLDFDLDRPSPELCREACANERRCRAYTYVTPGVQGPGARCWLKSGVPPAEPARCCVSGVKIANVPVRKAEPGAAPESSLHRSLRLREQAPDSAAALDHLRKLVEELESGRLSEQERKLARLLAEKTEAEGDSSWLSAVWKMMNSICRNPPPPPRAERPPASPDAQHVWIAGLWLCTPEQYIWVSGRWERPPHPRAVWVPGEWLRVPGGWKYRWGHWK